MCRIPDLGLLGGVMHPISNNGHDSVAPFNSTLSRIESHCSNSILLLVESTLGNTSPP